MWLLKLSSQSQKSRPAPTCGCRSLPGARRSGRSRHGSGTGRAARTGCTGPREQDGRAGGHPGGLQQTCQVSVRERSREARVGAMLIPSGLPRLGKVLVSRRSLVAASCRGDVLCRERKMCSLSSWRKGSGALCASAAALGAPCTLLCRSAPGRGSWGAAAAAPSAPQLWLEGGLLGAYPRCLPLPG